MQMDFVTLLVTNLVFSVKVTPIVVVMATLVRSTLLLTGKKRAFVTWTRNPVLSVVTILFAPGMLVTTSVRYVVCRLLGVDLGGVAGGGTYGEITVFLKVDKPPRVAILLTALYLSTLVSVFIGFALVAMPFVVMLGTPIVLLSWYTALGVLFNCCLKGGDLTLLRVALKKRTRSGAIELLVVLAVLTVFHIQIAELVF
jgi:hypothetical protein